MRKGFTLIELLVVIVIIGILVAIALPNFIRIKDKAREAEVKQNLHSVQLALERYSVDSLNNMYPGVIMGGDWTDTYVVWQSWITLQGLDPATIENPEKKSNWKPAGQDMGDPLVMDSYLSSYPGNPFIKGKGLTLTEKIHHYPCQNPVPRIAPFWRWVGGRNSNKMWECFGPDYFYPSALQSIGGDFYVHHIYFNPEYNFQGDEQKLPINGWINPSGNRMIVGNFSYWPRMSDINVTAGGFPWNALQDLAGYDLAGYGSPHTAGQDVYNRNGNYKGRYRTEGCLIDCSINGFPDVPCICATTNPPSRTQNDGGSDTVPDGVVIVLESGLDKKSSPASSDVTER